MTGETRHLHYLRRIRWVRGDHSRPEAFDLLRGQGAHRVPITLSRDQIRILIDRAGYILRQREETAIPCRIPSIEVVGDRARHSLPFNRDRRCTHG